MYTCITLYYYTHCTFEQMIVQAICSKEYKACCIEQIAQILPHCLPLRRATALFQHQIHKKQRYIRWWYIERFIIE